MRKKYFEKIGRDTVSWELVFGSNEDPDVTNLSKLSMRQTRENDTTPFSPLTVPPTTTLPALIYANLTLLNLTYLELCLIIT